jgi:hypothetical protein
MLAIPDIVVSMSLAKPALSPTDRQNNPLVKITDIQTIHNFSQYCDHLNTSEPDTHSEAPLNFVYESICDIMKIIDFNLS